jgi:hypothetical protein
MFPDLPLWMWLALAAFPVTMLGLMALVWRWAFRAQARGIVKRKAMFDAYFAARGSRCSDEDPDCRRVEDAVKELLEGGAFDVYWVAGANAGTVFEYASGVDRSKHGYGYLARSPVTALEKTVKIFPRTKLTLDYEPVFLYGREVREGWANPEFHRRFGVVAFDATVASRIVTIGLQSLLLELPEVSRLAREIIEIAVNKSYLAVLGRKGDWGANSGEPLPELDSHLRLAVRIRDLLGR